MYKFCTIRMGFAPGWGPFLLIILLERPLSRTHKPGEKGLPPRARGRRRMIWSRKAQEGVESATAGPCARGCTGCWRSAETAQNRTQGEA